MKHKILRLAIIITSSLTFGFFASPLNNRIDYLIPSNVQAKNVNYDLTRRINQFAKQRRAYHYPAITHNTRDLGGLKTANGREQIRPHMLYRSTNLHNITSRGARDLKRLHITQDIDLRAMHGLNGSIVSNPQPGEFHLMKDRYHLHLHYYYHPVETSQQETATWAARKRWGETYRFGYWYTYNPSARRAYHNSIIDMIRTGRHHNGALMYNCTQGRDRTGVLSIIVEAILGISKYNIYNDFLLTNHYSYQSPYTDQISRINRFYADMEYHYGNMNRYVRNGLHLSKSDLQRFRHEYLEKIK